MDGAGVAQLTPASVAAVVGLAWLDHKYVRVPFRRAILREIPVVAAMLLMGYMIGSFYRG